MIDAEVAMIEIDQAVPATAAIGVEEVSGVRAAKDLTDPVEGGIDRWRERTDRFDGEMEWFNAGLDRDAAAILGFHKLAGPVLASRIDPIRKIRAMLLALGPIAQLVRAVDSSDGAPGLKGSG